MTRKIHWHRITVTNLTGSEQTFMYPSGYMYWGVPELMNALEDLDCDGYPAVESYAGYSTIENGIDATYLYYVMEV